MKATDLALSRALGMRDAPAGAAHLLELDLGPVTANHLGTMHAAALFALAESASAERLRRDYGERAAGLLAVVRGATVKYRRAATGTVRAFARLEPDTAAQLEQDLATRTRIATSVLVEIRDTADQLHFSAQFDWFIGRPEGAS